MQNISEKKLIYKDLQISQFVKIKYTIIVDILLNIINKNKIK